MDTASTPAAASWGIVAPQSTAWIPLLVLIALHAAVAGADDGATGTRSRFTLGAEYDLSARAMWHGVAYDGEPYSYLSLWAGLADFTLTTAYGTAFSGATHSRRSDELDFTLTYSRDFGLFVFEPSLYGYYYLVDSGYHPTAEVSPRLVRAFGNLNLYTDHTVDVISYPGSYFGDVGGEYSAALPWATTVKGFVSLGWASATFNHVNIGPAVNATDVLETGLSFNRIIGAGIYLQPHVEFSHIIDNRLQQFTTPDVWNGGLTVGWSH